METGRLIQVEVIYLAENSTFHQELQVPAGCAVEAAVRLSGVLDKYPDFQLSAQNVGIYSRKVGLDHMIVEGDRIELYRPLHLTPNEIRKLRAKRRGTSRK